MSGYWSGQLLVLRMGNYLWRQKNHKLAKGMKIWKGNGKTKILFFLKKLKILLHERSGQMNTIAMEHFNKSDPANKKR